MRFRTRFAAVLAAASTVLLLPAAAQAQQVTGLEVRQDDGFATLSWDPVAGATEYDIGRTPVGAPGAGVVVGVGRPNRQINQDSPAFADAGFNPGDSFQWRVRARFCTEPQPYSQPVSGPTQPEFGDPGTSGESLRTQWEETNAATFTSDVNEYAYTAALDAASNRVRVVEIGRTVLGRPINMFIIGYPAPKPTAAAVSDNPAALLNCNVHGNEPSSREACLILARQLAFGDDARTIDILSNTTVLIVPAINGDGRAANTRGNSTGQDLNRDFSLIRQPETFAFVDILRDTMGLKNVVGALLEARSAGGETRPSDDGSNTPNSRKRKGYSALYNYHEFLDYFRANQADITQATGDGAKLQTLNTGRIVFRGSYDVPAFPPPHPGESPPPPEVPTPDQILEDPPCGYLLTEEQYNGPRTDGPAGLTTTVAERIEAHGWRVETRPGGYMVPLTQPERGLIPLLLDGQAAEPLVAAERLYGPPADGRTPLPDSACGLGRGPASPDLDAVGTG